MENQLHNIINIIGKIKDLKRSGWIMRNVTLPESDADHSYGVTLLAAVMAPNNLDKQKCLKMALIHDLPEIYTGDFTPYDNISQKDKHKLEREGALRLANEQQWPEIKDLIDEYNQCKTPEAKFVNMIDKLETVITAKYYDNNNRSPQNLIDEFSEYAKKYAQQYGEEHLSAIKDMINSF